MSFYVVGVLRVSPPAPVVLGWHRTEDRALLAAVEALICQAREHAEDAASSLGGLE
jgi:hypothetical protein